MIRVYKWGRRLARREVAFEIDLNLSPCITGNVEEKYGNSSIAHLQICRSILPESLAKGRARRDPYFLEAFMIIGRIGSTLERNWQNLGDFVWRAICLVEFARYKERCNPNS